jgi:hypothetical protein
MKKAQYRKYKEIYQVDLEIIKNLIKNCDAGINKEIENKNQKGGNIKKIDKNEKLYLLIPLLK